MNEVTEHFDSLANTYDTFKKKNWYYFENLKRIVRRYVPERSKVLEIGTATGEILSALEPSTGIGIDISPRMIAIASEKFKLRNNLRFIACRVEEMSIDLTVDYCVLVDVIEHVENLPSLTAGIVKVIGPKTKVVVTMANPLWEPVLLLLEKMKLKMPEGKHYRVSPRSLVSIFEARRLRLIERDTFIICPAHIPVLSDMFNALFHAIPLLRGLGLIQTFVFQPYEN